MSRLFQEYWDKCWVRGFIKGFIKGYTEGRGEAWVENRAEDWIIVMVHAKESAALDLLKWGRSADYSARLTGLQLERVEALQASLKKTGDSAMEAV